MAQIKIPGALAGATGVNKPDYAIAASLFKITTKYHFDQSDTRNLDHIKATSQVREGFQCK